MPVTRLGNLICTAQSIPQPSIRLESRDSWAVGTLATSRTCHTLEPHANKTARTLLLWHLRSYQNTTQLTISPLSSHDQRIPAKPNPSKKCSATLPTPHFCSLLGIFSPTHPMPSPLEQSHPRPSHAWRTPLQRLRRLHHLGWLRCLVVVLLVVMGFEGTAPKQQLPPSTSTIGGSKEAQLLSQASCDGN